MLDAKILAQNKHKQLAVIAIIIMQPSASNNTLSSVLLLTNDSQWRKVVTHKLFTDSDLVRLHSTELGLRGGNKNSLQPIHTHSHSPSA